MILVLPVMVTGGTMTWELCSTSAGLGMSLESCCEMMGVGVGCTSGCLRHTNGSTSPPRVKIIFLDLEGENNSDSFMSTYMSMYTEKTKAPLSNSQGPLIVCGQFWPGHWWPLMSLASALGNASSPWWGWLTSPWPSTSHLTFTINRLNWR